MNKNLILYLTLATSTQAFAQPLVGTLDPSLRRNVQLVYVEKAAGNFPAPAKPAEINQRNNVFFPHLLPVLVGSKVVFQSEDAELHNVFARSGPKVLFNQGQPPKQVFDKTFSQPGFVHLTCNIHKEMSAWVLVMENPYFTVPDLKTGGFKIEGLPGGSYTVRLWGEKLEPDVAAKKFTVTVGAGAAPIQVAIR